MTLKVINLFGGPGVGKSTVAAQIFAVMKSYHQSVELVTEFAKDLTWDGSKDILSDQLFILANQNRRLNRLVGKVEWAIVDSPLIMNFVYAPSDYLPTHYRGLIKEVFDQYENLNFLIQRNASFKYDPNGRNQTEDEAKEKDDEISSLLQQQGVEFTPILSTSNAWLEIFTHMRNYG
jgi:nicotinamide riboside kinase